PGGPLARAAPGPAVRRGRAADTRADAQRAGPADRAEAPLAAGALPGRAAGGRGRRGGLVPDPGAQVQRPGDGPHRLGAVMSGTEEDVSSSKDYSLTPPTA